MKKKNLFLGVLLASAAFSLAACGKNDTSTTTTGTTPVTTTDAATTTSAAQTTTQAAEKVTVTFQTNGGSTVAPAQITKGTKVTKPADPTKTEDATAKYTFGGWYKDAALTQAFDFNANVDANTVVYAKWNAQAKYSVTFNTNGGSTVTGQTVLAGEKATRPETDPTKDEDATTKYTFGGWFKEAACENAFDFDAAIQANTEIFAKWDTQGKFTVSFNSKGGSNVTAITVLDGEKATRPETDPTRENDATHSYEFAGWFKDEACTQEFDFATEVITSATTIYAGWTPTLLEFTVTFDTNGGSDIDTQTVTAGNKATRPETDPTKDDDEYSKYVFKGWYKDEDCTEEFKFDEEEITGATTIYADWTEIAKTFKITINSDDVIKEVETGNKIDISKMVVTATDSNNDTKTVDAKDYTVVVTGPDSNEFDITNTVTEPGKYTVKVSYDGCKASFDINVTVPQYKFDVNWLPTSLIGTYELDYVFPDGTYTLYNSTSLKVGLVAQQSNSQVKFQKDSTPKTLDGETYEYRVSIHSKNGYLTVTPTVSGKITILATVNGADRKIVVKDSTGGETSGDSDWSSSNLYKLTVDVKANETYTINSSNNGCVVYGVNLAASVDASTKVDDVDFKFTPDSTQFDIKDDVFDTANVAGTAIAANNYGVERTVSPSELTITVKNSANEVVTGEIKTAGNYKVTVALNDTDKSVTYDIVVEDKDAVITAVNVDSTNATKVFHEGDELNTDNIKVTATKGVTVDLTAADYNVKLYSGDTKVDDFTTTGKYTVRVYANDTTVYGSYDVDYYAIKSTKLTALDSMIIKKGATTYDVLAKATYTFDDDTTADATKNIDSALYSDSACTTPTTTDAFANEGTVYCKLTIKDQSKVVTLTVKELSPTEYSFGDKTGDIAKDSYFIGGYDKEKSNFTAEFNVQLAGIGGSYAADKSTATANDESGKTFTKAVLPSGDTKADGKEYVLTSTVDCYVTIYFTTTDKKFTTDDQSKGGDLVINGETIQTVNGNKSNKIAYAYTFYVKANETYKLRASSNRLAVFGFVVEK